MAQVLLADDEKDLVWAVEEFLTQEGFAVVTAPDGEEALSLVRSHALDLVILDVAMPKMDGLEVCREIRRATALRTLPVLFLTQRIAIEDRVRGLDLGGDDYLTKPFDLRELAARIRALLRRSPRFPGESRTTGVAPRRLVVGKLCLDPASLWLVVDGGNRIQLTRTECLLLRYLMSQPGKVVSARGLLEGVWRYPSGVGDTSVVRWHIRNVRERLEPDPQNPVYLRTRHPNGYYIQGEN